MKIGTLRHRIQIQTKTISEDSLKQQIESWTDVDTVWARIEPLSGREYFQARQEIAEVSVKVTVRYRNDIAPSMRLRFEDRIFEVLSVINPEERCILLLLMCKEVYA